MARQQRNFHIFYEVMNFSKNIFFIVIHQDYVKLSLLDIDIQITLFPCIFPLRTRASFYKKNALRNITPSITLVTVVPILCARRFTYSIKNMTDALARFKTKRIKNTQ